MSAESVSVLLCIQHYGMLTVPGFSISPEQLRNVVKTYVDANPTSGWASLGPTISGLKSTPELRWANPLDVKNITEQLFTEIFGPKETGKAKGKVR